MIPDFDAAKVVTPLSHSFKPFVDYEGTVPEPSRAEIKKFLRGLAKITGELMDARAAAAKADDERERQNEDTQPKAYVEMLLEAFDQAGELTDQQRDVVLEFCKGSPSREDFEAAPGRLQVAFVGWLVGKFANPPITTPDMRPSLAVVPDE